MDFEQAEAFDRDGYIVVHDLLGQAEVDDLLARVESGLEGTSAARHHVDAEGRPTSLLLWSGMEDNPFADVACDARLVSAAHMLLREDVYLWHSKVMLKAAGAGSWEWHQDYGYWYRERCLRPAMLACMLVLDQATQENGCLKVLVGSHRFGRMDHGIVGDQAMAESDRLRALEERLPVAYLEAEPGAAIFFHCNTLHSSEPNLSSRSRRALICAYNATSNAPYDGSGPAVVDLTDRSRRGAGSEAA